MKESDTLPDPTPLPPPTSPTVPDLRPVLKSPPPIYVIIDGIKHLAALPPYLSS